MYKVNKRKEKININLEINKVKNRYKTDENIKKLKTMENINKTVIILIKIIK